LKKILTYRSSRKVNAVVISSLIVSIIITNSFVIFSPDVDTRSYNAILTSTISVGVALVVCLVQVFRYKITIRKQKRIEQSTSSEETDDKWINYYYDNNKMHFSICLFLILWLSAQGIWLSQYEIVSNSIADALWFIGYASFGYFLYSLYYHVFRREFEPLVLILIAIIIIIVMIFVLDIIVSALRLISTQELDFSVVLVTLVYPVLDAVLIFPAILIFLAVRRISKRQTALLDNQETGQRRKEEEKTRLSFSSLWILLLSVMMVLSAIGDIGYAFSAAMGPDIVQRDIWIWGIIFNTDHLCLAAALIGYRYFFYFHKYNITIPEV
jgi:hypothetical protein